MAEGWRRGAKGIDGNKGADFLTRKTVDNGSKHDIASKDLHEACDPWDLPTWKPARLPRA